MIGVKSSTAKSDLAAKASKKPKKKEVESIVKDEDMDLEDDSNEINKSSKPKSKSKLENAGLKKYRKQKQKKVELEKERRSRSWTKTENPSEGLGITLSWFVFCTLILWNSFLWLSRTRFMTACEALRKKGVRALRIWTGLLRFYWNSTLALSLRFRFNGIIRVLSKFLWIKSRLGRMVSNLFPFCDLSCQSVWSAIGWWTDLKDALSLDLFVVFCSSTFWWKCSL